MKPEQSNQRFQPGKPRKPLAWLKNLREREEMIRYLKSAERYWFGEGFGSESGK
ncbi:MAG TPA: hypothetical protein PKX93_10750 [bacterium]|nr:hypothetical protein [bacterium]HOL67922.1 hypothetical protein [bacterium]HPP11841.1 hypothetical protein [bacterium]